MGIASLILGILSILGGPTGTIFAIVGLILGSLAKKKNPENPGPAKIGFIVSIIGLVLSILCVIGCVACVGCGVAESGSYYY